MMKRAVKAPSQRQLRVGEEVRHALALVLERGGVRDPGLKDATVTVTEVRMSPDLGKATAFVTSLGGGAEEVAAVVHALQRARPHLRRLVGRAIKLKYVPDMNFVADASFDEVARIDSLLRDPRVARDLPPPATADAKEPWNGT